MTDFLLYLGAVLLAAVAVGVIVRVATRRPSLPGLAAPAEPEEALAPVPENRFVAALRRTREALGGSLTAVFGAGKKDEALWDALEEALVRADVGAKTSLALVEALRAGGEGTPAEMTARLRALVAARVGRYPTALATAASGPLVVLVVGVNGSGKTTTIGKLAARYKAAGKSVLLAAGDTFRAGAIEQLKIWGERAGVPVIAHQEGADPAAVCHDAVQAAVSRGIDVVICDTAGRLQAHATLMDELAKIRRVIVRTVPDAPHEVLLVLDGTMGQNALSQARVFADVARVTGIVLTKLDGTAKGGVVVAIAEELGIPVKLVGLGEKIEDLRAFDARAFVDALVPDAGS